MLDFRRRSINRHDLAEAEAEMDIEDDDSTQQLTRKRRSTTTTATDGSDIDDSTSLMSKINEAAEATNLLHRRVKRHSKYIGPVYTYVKTDKHARFKWGVKHKVGKHHG